MPDMLPDCRMKDRRQFTQTVLGISVPTFCANCGRRGPDVPEDGCTFAFWLCNPCFATHGAETLGLVMPDEVFFEKVKQEQLAAHGRFLTEAELITIVETDASSLATLLKERPTL